MSSGPLQGIVSYPGLAWGNSYHAGGVHRVAWD